MARPLANAHHRPHTHKKGTLPHSQLKLRLSPSRCLSSTWCCVCMHAHTLHHRMSAHRSSSCASELISSLPVRQAAMEQMQAKYCIAIMVPMMQRSHSVVLMGVWLFI